MISLVGYTSLEVILSYLKLPTTCINKLDNNREPILKYLDSKFSDITKVYARRNSWSKNCYIKLIIIDKDWNQITDKSICDLTLREICKKYLNEELDFALSLIHTANNDGDIEEKSTIFPMYHIDMGSVFARDWAIHLNESSDILQTIMDYYTIYYSK